MDENIENLDGGVAIFFKLNLPIQIQQEILQENGYKLAPGVPRGIVPGVMTGPSTIHIADDEETKTKIEYVSDRYLLRIIGPLKHLYKQNEKVASSFANERYLFSDIVRYCEFSFSSMPLNAPELIKKIRSVDIKGLSFRSLIGRDFRPYSLSVSDPSNPLTDEWTHIIFTPDANCADNKITVIVTKRTKNHSDMLKFLEDIGDKINRIIE